MAKNPEHKMTDREIDIGQRIRGAVTQISQTLTDKSDALESVQALAAEEISGRVAVILEIADMANVENWTESEVFWGCGYAIKVKGNDDRTAKSIATFCAEMRNVASSKVRALVPAIYEHVKSAWDAETEMLVEDKDAAKPLRKFAKRFYHLFVDAIRKTKIGEVYITSPADVVLWAEANDPDLNAGVIADRIEKIALELSAMFRNFAHSDLQECAVALGQLDQKTIAATRTGVDLTATLPKPPQKPLQAVEPAAATPPPAKPLAAVSEPPRPVPVPVEDAGIEGVVDTLLDGPPLVELAEAAD